MKIVYVKNVPKVAQKGDIKEVADGYGRFLLSNGTAVLATSATVNTISQQKKHKEDLKQKSVGEFKTLSDALKDKTFIIQAKVSTGKHLFGGVHEEDIKNIIQKETGIFVNPKSIKIPKIIKELGVYTIIISQGTMHTEFQLQVEAK